MENDPSDSIGAEEAQEMIEDFENEVVPSILEFLGEKDAHILNDEQLRNAFFAGIRYSDFHEEKFGRRP